MHPHLLVFKLFSGPFRGAGGSGWPGVAGVGGGEGDPTRFRTQRNHAPLLIVYIEVPHLISTFLMQ